MFDAMRCDANNANSEFGIRNSEFGIRNLVSVVGVAGVRVLVCVHVCVHVCVRGFAGKN
jgi:hypothetical protein